MSQTKGNNLCLIPGLVTIDCNRNQQNIPYVLKEKIEIDQFHDNWIGASFDSHLEIKFSKPVFISEIELSFFGENRYFYDMHFINEKKEKHSFLINSTSENKTKILMNKEGVCSLLFKGKNSSTRFFLLTDIKIFGRVINSLDLSQRDESIFDDFKKLLDEKSETSDLTIVCGNEKFYVHKFILSSRSDYFQSMFKGNFLEKKSKVIVLNEESVGFKISKKSVRGLLNFIYTGSINVKVDDLDEVIELSRVADRFMLKKMGILCHNVIKNNLNNENVFKILKYAHQLSLDSLAQVCELYFKKKLK